MSDALELGSIEWSRRRIAECAVQGASLGRTVVPVGPFRACLDPSTDMVFLNYVVPVWALGSSEETHDQLSQLRAVFHENKRRLRFEFIDGIWPQLVAELERFGLELQLRVPLMSCTPDQFLGSSAPNVEVRMVDASDERAVMEFFKVQRGAFGMPDAAIEQSEVDQLRHQIENEFWRCAVAYVDGTPAGAGSLVITGTVCELAGVGTADNYRRRGVASTVNSALITSHFSRGGDLVWLSAADDQARAVYQKIGFTVIGDQFHYIEPEVA